MSKIKKYTNDPDIEIKKLILPNYYPDHDIIEFKDAFVRCVWNILNNSNDEKQKTKLKELYKKLEQFKDSMDNFIEQWEKEHDEDDE